jgi:hypothetical protein
MGLTEARRAFTAVVAALPLTACLSILGGEAVSKDAKTLPDNERAVLLGRSQWYLAWGRDISLFQIDGVLYDVDGLKQAEVTPGHHSVVIEQIAFLGGMGGNKKRYFFTLDLQAGHDYQILSVQDWYQWPILDQQQERCRVEIEDVPPGLDHGTHSQLPCEIYNGN